MTSPALRVRTVEIDDDSPLVALLPAGLPPRQLTSWVRRGEGLIGWGRAASVTVAAANRFADAQDWWLDLIAASDIVDEVEVPGSGAVAFGSFSYSPASPGPAAGGTVVVPRVVVGRRIGTTWLTTVEVDGEPAEPVSLAVATPPTSPGEVTYSDGALPGPRYEAAVAEAVRQIAAGRLDKVVLARDLYADTQEPIDVRWLLARLSETYDKTWAFSVDGIVGGTPEMLVRLDKGLVTSRVLAGTIRRTGNDEHDLMLAGSLARSSKDLEEHEYAVRSVAEALAPYCTSMNVPEAPSVLHLPNVMHLSTDVAGRLRNGPTSLVLAGALHPSAAVCGTPKAVADEVIRELEGMDRGRYAGPVGWMDSSGDGEWGIALRSGLLDEDDPRRIRLFAGCGIVAGSDPEEELAESDAKLIPMRSALEA